MFNHENYYSQPYGLPLTNGYLPHNYINPNYVGHYPNAMQTPHLNQASSISPNTFAPSYLPPSNGSNSLESIILREKLDHIQLQLTQLTELFNSSMVNLERRNFLASNTGYAAMNQNLHGNPYMHQTPSYETNQCGTLRESETHIFMEIYFPHLTMSDIDVEISGNRVICRTRVPVAHNDRINLNAKPRGFDLFVLPDGRLEFIFVVPTSFVAKEVDAVWREGFISICIPKTAITKPQSVKVTEESLGARKGASTGSHAA